MRKLILVTVSVSAILGAVYYLLSGEQIVGGIVYRVNDENQLQEYLLVTQKSADKWIFPKGKVKIWETASQAAEREVFEEAGVFVTVMYKIKQGPFKYSKTSGKIQYVNLYLMRFEGYVSEWEEGEYRKRQWNNFDDASRYLSQEFARALEIVDKILIVN